MMRFGLFMTLVLTLMAGFCTCADSIFLSGGPQISGFFPDGKINVDIADRGQAGGCG